MGDKPKLLKDAAEAVYVGAVLIGVAALVLSLPFQYLLRDRRKTPTQS